MIEFNEFYKLAASLGIGFIIGMQRSKSSFESSTKHPAGLRTFSIVSLSGALTCFMSELMDSLSPFITGFVLVGALLVVNHLAHGIASKEEDGLTTSFSLMMVYLLGALCWYNRLLEACILMIALLSLLTLKKQLHEFATKISTGDIIATVKFAVISLMVLPFLPNQFYGPSGLEVLNPHTIWLFVVFISGISFVGYVLIKIVGPGRGIWLTGLLGGLASSTALTLDLSEKSKENPDFSENFSVGIIFSWVVMYIRLYLICVIIAPVLAYPLALPLLLPAFPTLVYALILKKVNSSNHVAKSANFNNPFKLLPAIKFGIVFTVIIFFTNAIKLYLGSSALMVGSFLGGTAAVDALAFSLLDMSLKSTLSVKDLILALLLAGLANTLTKAVMVWIVGSKQLRNPIIISAVLLSVTSLGLVFYYL